MIKSISRFASTPKDQKLRRKLRSARREKKQTPKEKKSHLLTRRSPKKR